ncbi:MAG: hypothetical protein WBH09_05650, partial [Rugosibacter sp.]
FRLGLRPALQNDPPSPDHRNGGVSVLDRQHPEKCVSFKSALTASAIRRGFLRSRGFCALSPVAQAVVFRPAAVSPAPTFFAVRRFVRFIQPAPNPAFERSCAIKPRSTGDVFR